MSFFSSLSALEKFVIICDGDILVPDRTVCEPKVEVVAQGIPYPMKKVGTMEDMLTAYVYTNKDELFKQIEAEYFGPEELRLYHSENNVLDIIINYIFPRLASRLEGYRDQIKPVKRSTIPVNRPMFPNDDELSERCQERRPVDDSQTEEFSDVSRRIEVDATDFNKCLYLLTEFGVYRYAQNIGPERKDTRIMFNGQHSGGGYSHVLP